MLFSVLLSLWEPFDVSLFDAFALLLRGDEDEGLKGRLSLKLGWLEKIWPTQREMSAEFHRASIQYIALSSWLLDVGRILLDPEVYIILLIFFLHRQYAFLIERTYLVLFFC